MLAVGVPQKPGVVRFIPPASAFKSIVLAVGGVGQVVAASVTPLIVPVPPNVTTKFENWLNPELQPLGGVTGMDDKDVGEAGQGTIAAHAGAAIARGTATIKSRLNIGVFFIEL
jgi:hypothetical protein